MHYSSNCNCGCDYDCGCNTVISPCNSVPETPPSTQEVIPCIGEKCDEMYNSDCVRFVGLPNTCYQLTTNQSLTSILDSIIGTISDCAFTSICFRIDYDGDIQSCLIPSSGIWNNKNYYKIKFDSCSNLIGYVYWNSTLNGQWEFSNQLGGGSVIYATLPVPSLLPISVISWSVVDSTYIIQNSINKSCTYVPPTIDTTNPLPFTPLCETAQPCDQTIESDCVVYEKTYECLDIQSGDTVTKVIDAILNKLNLIDCTPPEPLTCNCYLVINNGESSKTFSYDTCGEGSDNRIETLLSNQRTYVCSSTYPIPQESSNIKIGIVNSLTCDELNPTCTNPSSYCHTITVTGGDDVNIQYINYQGVLQQTGSLTSGTYTFCGWKNSFDKLSGDANYTISVADSPWTNCCD